MLAITTIRNSESGGKHENRADFPVVLLPEVELTRVTMEVSPE